MKNWKKFAALGLAVTMLGGCMPQKVEKTETQAAQSEQETKADAAKDTAAEGGESTAAQDEEGAYRAGGGYNLASVFGSV